MPASKTKRKIDSKSAHEQVGFLATAARSVGHAAGKAVKAIGFETAPQSLVGKTSTRLSARARRKTQAEEVKAKATRLLSKASPDPGAPFRRVMGKPAANWSDKDIALVSGVVAKKKA